MIAVELIGLMKYFPFNVHRVPAEIGHWLDDESVCVISKDTVKMCLFRLGHLLIVQ